MSFLLRSYISRWWRTISLDCFLTVNDAIIGVINSFSLCRADVFQIFAWLNMHLQISSSRQIFSLIESEKANGEIGRKWVRNECNRFILMYVSITAAIVIDICLRAFWTQWTETFSEYNPSLIWRTRLAWAKDCCQPHSNVQVPFMWIFIMKQVKSQVWTPKYLGQKYNFRATCGSPLWLHREVAVKLKSDSINCLQTEVKVPSGPFVQLFLFVVLQVLAHRKI